jgi:hypothetical protein
MKGILGDEDQFKTKGTGGFDKVLDIPYDSVQEYGFPEPNRLSITQKDGNTKEIEVAGSTLFLKMSLKDLIP